MQAAWRAEPPLAPPTVLPALPAGTQVSSFDVGVTAFTSPSVGWTVVGGLTDCWLLRTDDAGQTWTPRLSCPTQIRTLSAFGARGVGLVVGVAPTRDKVNGHGVGTGDYGSVMVGTEDAGSTWAVGTPPRPKELTGIYHLLSARRLSALAAPIGHARRHVVRTDDGGASWAAVPCLIDHPAVRVAFSSTSHGVLVAADRSAADVLYATGDGGQTWTRVTLPPPPGVPASAEILLQPVIKPGAPALLVLKASPGRRSRQGGWRGHYAYLQDGGMHKWSGPYRLPPSQMGPDVPVTLVFGGDGRFWAAAGHDIWVASTLDGPWEHRPVPLPGVQMLGATWDPRLAPVPTETVIADIAPVGGGVVWLTSTRGTALGGLPSGQLYRSEDGGVRWTKLMVESR
jgi:photosystem II stability/assembly factor-like uncharacterized protein